MIPYIVIPCNSVFIICYYFSIIITINYYFIFCHSLAWLELLDTGTGLGSLPSLSQQKDNYYKLLVPNVPVEEI